MPAIRIARAWANSFSDAPMEYAYKMLFLGGDMASIRLPFLTSTNMESNTAMNSNSTLVRSGLLVLDSGRNRMHYGDYPPDIPANAWFRVSAIALRRPTAQGDSLDNIVYMAGSVMTMNGNISSQSTTSNLYQVSIMDDGSYNWDMLVKGIQGRVDAMKAIQSRLYVMGSFTPVNITGFTPYLASYDMMTRQWNAQDPLLKSWSMSTVQRITTLVDWDQNRILMGGSFQNIAGTPCLNVCLWNQAAWEQLSAGQFNETVPSGLTGGLVRAIAVADPDTVWIGGDFDTLRVGNTTRSIQSLAVYYAGNDTLSAAAANVPGNVTALAYQSPDLLVGGTGTSGPPFILRWPSPGCSNYTDISQGYFQSPGQVSFLVSIGGTLLVGGNFTRTDGDHVSVASYTGYWSSVLNSSTMNGTPGTALALAIQAPMTKNSVNVGWVMILLILLATLIVLAVLGYVVYLIRSAKPKPASSTYSSFKIADPTSMGFQSPSKQFPVVDMVSLPCTPKPNPLPSPAIVKDPSQAKALPNGFAVSIAAWDRYYQAYGGRWSEARMVAFRALPSEPVSHSDYVCESFRPLSNASSLTEIIMEYSRRNIPSTSEQSTVSPSRRTIHSTTCLDIVSDSLRKSVKSQQYIPERSNMRRSRSCTSLCRIGSISVGSSVYTSAD